MRPPAATIFSLAPALTLIPRTVTPRANSPFARTLAGPLFARISPAATSDSVVISVIDTGVGIPAENLDRIFNHGFTTRPDGHGFGLHSAALAAKELGGSLRAESAGPGKGATFTLTLPLTPPESVHVD